MSNMAGVLQEAETAYSSGAPSLPPVFGGVHVAHLFLVYMCYVCAAFGCVFVFFRNLSVLSILPFLLIIPSVFLRFSYYNVHNV